MGKLERYFDAVARIKAEGVSANGWVTVVRGHDADLKVNIRPGMLRRCNPDQVASEIRTALLAAVADHRRQYRQLRIDYFGSPIGVEPFTLANSPQGERGGS
ncbi:hypothetical protein C7C45_32760 [Micromonospora arborensis]|uniref:YbaB/EbfC family DNA-binding protein n=1 Tax=Micromonospora arborensis TaxID=2116518 RepID=A0A318NT14_9ACTN|nr:hypothetical protein [Micromonospora arborensis]PYC62795.1 hypothetical protein C7C45_32760 [Micromonospora arborensis]